MEKLKEELVWEGRFADWVRNLSERTMTMSEGRIVELIIPSEVQFQGKELKSWPIRIRLAKEWATVERVHPERKYFKVTMMGGYRGKIRESYMFECYTTARNEFTDHELWLACRDTWNRIKENLPQITAEIEKKLKL